MKNTLFGDGIHDDYPAIQEMLDSGSSAVNLPPPSVRYAISRTLLLHSGQTLALNPTSEIRLLPGSNCPLLKNDPSDPAAHDIHLSGGIWNMDNLNQSPNPIHPEWANESKSPFPFVEWSKFSGVAMEFSRVNNLTLRSLTLKNPTIYGVVLEYVNYFTVADIRFDYATVNPRHLNMDGIHLNGNCRNGRICNMQGVCYDDLVALNADEGDGGPIENIQIDGIFAENCHSAVRLLSRGARVHNIAVSNVFGSFYCYGIGITQYSGTADDKGDFGSLSFHNIFASQAVAPSDYHSPAGYPVIYGQGTVHVESLSIGDLHRVEKLKFMPTVNIPDDMSVDSLSITDSSMRNLTGKEILFMDVRGRIDTLMMRSIVSDGKIQISKNAAVGRIIADDTARELIVRE